MRSTLVLVLATVALASVCAAQTLADNGNWSCALPKAYGGAGTCQPFCTPTYITASTKPDCSVALGSCPACTDANYATQVPGVGSQTCVQSTDSRCTSAALSALFSAWPNVQAAYCTDQDMVIHLGASPLTFRNTNAGHDLSFMDDVIYPPVSNQYNCATRKASWSCSSYNVFKFPLTMTLHSTASPSNNANTAAFGPTASAGSTGGWLKLRSREAVGLQSDVGLPAYGPTGYSLTGQMVYPVYNNKGYLDAEECNLNHCSEHSGAGCGIPHAHGDPFSSSNLCQYGPANYTDVNAHPPLLGFALDGGYIYGRHFYTTNLGANVPLDLCGGHQHGNMAYHYHNQVVQSTTTGTAGGMPPASTYGAGKAYNVSVFGPYQCWRGNVAASKNFYQAQSDFKDVSLKFCSGMTNSYIKAGSGISWGNTGSNTGSGTGSGTGTPKTSAATLARVAVFPIAATLVAIAALIFA